MCAGGIGFAYFYYYWQDIEFCSDSGIFYFSFFMTMAANQYIYVPTNCIIKCFHSFFAEMIKIHESILHVSSQIWHTFCQGLTIWCTVCRQREKCYLKNDWKTEIPYSVSSSSLLIIVHVRTFFIDGLTWSFGWFLFKWNWNLVGYPGNSS